ncbi:MAG: DinB family protein [Chloroflexota bacterium]
MTGSWVAQTVGRDERDEPMRPIGEREALEKWLDYHRDTLLWKCSGLTGEQLARRAVPPSSLSLLGLVRHMAGVERWWFRIHVGGQDLEHIFFTEDNLEGDFNDLDPNQAEQNIEAYRREIDLARQAAAGKHLDEAVFSRGDHPDRQFNVRTIYLHMIEEYARHNGHADLIRERIDGVIGD